MDSENLIEDLRIACAGNQHNIMGVAATAISTLQAENEKLRAKLEQVKAERDAALEHLHGICSACKSYSPYHNRGKCRFCAYEPVRDKDAEVNDNLEWRGPGKED